MFKLLHTSFCCWSNNPHPRNRDTHCQVFGLCTLLLGTGTYNASVKWPFFKYPYEKNPHMATPGMEKIMHSPAINKRYYVQQQQQQQKHSAMRRFF